MVRARPFIFQTSQKNIYYHIYYHLNSHHYIKHSINMISCYHRPIYFLTSVTTFDSTECSSKLRFSSYTLSSNPIKNLLLKLYWQPNICNIRFKFSLITCLAILQNNPSYHVTLYPLLTRVNAQISDPKIKYSKCVYFLNTPN